MLQSLTKRQILTILLGLIAGSIWFLYNLSLPSIYRGEGCCDVQQYFALSQGTFSSVASHSSFRVFGYPLILHTSNTLFTNPQLAARLIELTQLLVAFASSAFLFYALRVIGLPVPFAGLALLLSHPGLTSAASLRITDSLTTSIFSIAIGVMAMLFNGHPRTRALTFILGILLGILPTLRPSFGPLIFTTLPLILIGMFHRSLTQARNPLSALGKTSILVGIFCLGFLPPLAKLALNCKSATGKYALIDPATSAQHGAASINWGFHYIRLWSVVSEHGFKNFNVVQNSTFDNCNVEPPHLAQGLLKCYSGHWREVPEQILNKTISLSDNYHLNSYASEITPQWVVWYNRFFNAITFIGLFSAIYLLARGTIQRRFLSTAFTIPALVYVAIQVNMHIETRYMFPVTPLFFLLSCTSISLIRKSPPIWRTLGAVCILALAALFFQRITMWDSLPIVAM